MGTLPAARHSHTMFYDPLGGTVVLFGGQLSSSTNNDLWEYSAAANKWTKIYPSGSAPSARAGHSMIYDPATARAIVFGGRAGAFYGDCWAFSPATETWTELQPKLSAAARAVRRRGGLRLRQGPSDRVRRHGCQRFVPGRPVGVGPVGGARLSRPAATRRDSRQNNEEPRFRGAPLSLGVTH